MDDILNADKTVLFVAFVIPGFISLKFYQLLFPGKEQPTADQLIDAVAYSAINYALLSIPILLVEQSQLATTIPWLYYSFYAFAVFLAPVAWVGLWKFIRTRKFFQQHAPHPTGKAWDYVFSNRKAPCWAKVHLKDGTVIAGRYGLNSFTSSAPNDEQIYLEEAWSLNEKGGFDKRHKRTAGVIVACDIAYIELRNVYDDLPQEGQHDRGTERQSGERLSADPAS